MNRNYFNDIKFIIKLRYKKYKKLMAFETYKKIILVANHGF